MATIEVRTSFSEWTTIPIETAKEWLQRATYINYYDAIASDPDRIESLDLAIPAFLEAVPNFKGLLDDLGPDIERRLSHASQALSLLPQSVDLWDWDDSDKNRRLIYNVFKASRHHGFAYASFTKMLHRKRPRLIPIIDSWIKRAWSDNAGPDWTYD